LLVIEDQHNDKNEQWTKVSHKRVRKHYTPKLSESNDVERWVNYVNGSGKRPQEHKGKSNYYSPTVISKSRPELARNKPLVKCTVGGITVNTLFDTGAELNVISRNVFERIKATNPKRHFQLYQCSTRMRCANDSVLKSVGTVYLSIKIGMNTSSHPFLVVDDILPRVICGIRMMKRLNINVLPGKNCISMGNENLNFVSQIFSENIPRSLN